MRLVLLSITYCLFLSAKTQTKVHLLGTDINYITPFHYVKYISAKRTAGVGSFFYEQYVNKHDKVRASIGLHRERWNDTYLDKFSTPKGTMNSSYSSDYISLSFLVSHNFIPIEKKLELFADLGFSGLVHIISKGYSNHTSVPEKNKTLISFQPIFIPYLASGLTLRYKLNHSYYLGMNFRSKTFFPGSSLIGMLENYAEPVLLSFGASVAYRFK